MIEHTDTSAGIHRPLPIITVFVVCREILQDRRSGQFILIGPTSHWPTHNFLFPCRVAIYAEFTGLHAPYVPKFILRDSLDDIVWTWKAESPFGENNPLLPIQVTFWELLMNVPKPGRYRLEFLLNNEEVINRVLVFGPVDLQTIT